MIAFPFRTFVALVLTLATTLPTANATEYSSEVALRLQTILEHEDYHPRKVEIGLGERLSKRFSALLSLALKRILDLFSHVGVTGKLESVSQYIGIFLWVLLAAALSLVFYRIVALIVFPKHKSIAEANLLQVQNTPIDLEADPYLALVTMRRLLRKHCTDLHRLPPGITDRELLQHLDSSDPVERLARDAVRIFERTTFAREVLTPFQLKSLHQEFRQHMELDA